MSYQYLARQLLLWLTITNFLKVAAISGVSAGIGVSSLLRIMMHAGLVMNDFAILAMSVIASASHLAAGVSTPSLLCLGSCHVSQAPILEALLMESVGKLILPFLRKLMINLPEVSSKIFICLVKFSTDTEVLAVWH
jgi:hypothetical protein